MRRSYVIALTVTLVSVLWLASGALTGKPVSSEASANTPEAAVTRVQVRTFRAEPVTREVVLHGQTEARRRVLLKAESAGQVVELPVARGSRVRGGVVIARLAADEREERLAQALALVRQRELEYDATRSLKSQNLNAERQVAEALALLEAARTELKSAHLHLARAEIRAPFDGVLYGRAVEIGDFVGVGDPVATVVELNPLLATGDVAEQEVTELRLGMPGRARLVDGRELHGTLSYIAPAAAVTTRTFAVEMETANPGGAIPAGMTAELRIPLEEVDAHRLSAALLSLDDTGRIGVKWVDGAGVVQFEPVRIIRSEGEALWVDGLPSEARLITAGQGFVRAGDRVEVLEEGR